MSKGSEENKLEVQHVANMFKAKIDEDGEFKDDTRG